MAIHTYVLTSKSDWSDADLYITHHLTIKYIGPASILYSLATWAANFSGYLTSAVAYAKLKSTLQYFLPRKSDVDCRETTVCIDH